MALRIKRCVVRGARPQGITAPSGTFRVPGPHYGARAHITGHQTVLWGTRPGSVLGLGLLEKESLHRELGQGLSPAEPHHDQQHTPGKRASLGRACYLTPPNRALKILFFFYPGLKSLQLHVSSWRCACPARHRWCCRGFCLRAGNRGEPLSSCRASEGVQNKCHCASSIPPSGSGTLSHPEAAPGSLLARWWQGADPKPHINKGTDFIILKTNSPRKVQARMGS